MDAQGTLIIQEVAPEDAGNYTCQAANEVGTDEETVTLYYTGTWATSISGEGPPPFLPPIHKYLLSICCVAGTGEAAGTTWFLSRWGLYSKRGTKQTSQQINRTLLAVRTLGRARGRVGGVTCTRGREGCCTPDRPARASARRWLLLQAGRGTVLQAEGNGGANSCSGG